MKAYLIKYLSYCITLSLLTFILIPVSAQKVGQGLKFAPQETLMGIPLASTPFSGREMPSSVDLSNRMPPPGNQGEQESCVGWAVAYAVKSYQEKQEGGYSYYSNGRLDPKKVFSPAYIYNQINNGVDGGSYFTDALNLVSQQGVVKWSDMPYNENDYLTRPNSSQKSKAKNYRIDFWRRVNIQDIKEVKAQVNAGYPVLIGAGVDRAFIDGGNKAISYLPYIWRVKGSTVGGHAMTVVGFDDKKNAFKILNSWGQDWGNDGYCWIDYTLFPKVVREGYVMKDAITPETTNDVDLSVLLNIDDDDDQQQVEQQDDFTLISDLLEEYNWYMETDFTTSQVYHNVSDATYGNTMQVHGSLQIPASKGSQYQVVVLFYYNNGYGGKGQPVGSTNGYFMMPDGAAATGTSAYTIPYNGVNVNWSAFIPYSALNCQKGSYDMWGNYQAYTSYIVAEPILFIDNFAVQYGELIAFYVSL